MTMARRLPHAVLPARSRRGDLVRDAPLGGDRRSRVAVFVLSIAGFGLVQQQFFPSANRPELVVDLWLPSGASIVATEREAKRFEKVLEGRSRRRELCRLRRRRAARASICRSTSSCSTPTWPSSSSPREGNQVRDAVAERLLDKLDNEFTLLRGRVNPLQNGPPVAYPVQFRVSGPDFAELRAHRRAGRRRDARQSEHVPRASGLERAVQGRASWRSIRTRRG